MSKEIYDPDLLIDFLYRVHLKNEEEESWKEVMLNNFIEMGINPNFIDIIVNIENGIIPDEWLKLVETYAARFFFYEDTRKTKHYMSSIRPNILKQHWENHPYLKNDTIFKKYVDWDEKYWGGIIIVFKKVK